MNVELTINEVEEVCDVLGMFATLTIFYGNYKRQLKAVNFSA